MNIEELEKLAQLKEKGIITEDEFNQKKAELLNIETSSPENTVKMLNLKQCAEESFDTKIGIGKIYDSAVNAINYLGYKIEESSKKQGVITFETPKTLCSYGQVIQIIISKSTENIVVSITGKCLSFQIYDWGERKRIAKKILNYIKQNI